MIGSSFIGHGKLTNLERKLKLIQYRDAGMNSYTYFYVNDKNKMLSPFFNSEIEAKEWLDAEAAKFDNWKPDRNFV